MILTILNQPDDFILAIFLIENETVNIGHLFQLFTNELDLVVMGVNYQLATLPERAESPQ